MVQLVLGVPIQKSDALHGDSQVLGCGFRLVWNSRIAGTRGTIRNAPTITFLSRCHRRERSKHAIADDSSASISQCWPSHLRGCCTLMEGCSTSEKSRGETSLLDCVLDRTLTPDSSSRDKHKDCRDRDID